jgi:molecular chaperone GrpE
MSKKEDLVKGSKDAPQQDRAATPPAETPRAPAGAPKGTSATGAAPAPAPATEPSLTPRQLEELKARAAKADEHWERLLRTAADLENFKKRSAREKQEAIRFANEALLAKLLPALDHFDMALAAANNAEGTTVESLKTGVTMIHNQLKKALAEAGLEEIDATAQPFDPNFHEAVTEEESSAIPAGHVIRQLRRGYKLRQRLIRPASVVVAKKPASA